MKHLAALLAITASALAPHTLAQDASSPDMMVKLVATAVEKGRPDIIFRALPAQYQQDLQGVVKEFAETVDPEVHGAVVKLVQKAGRVLADKKDMLLAMDELKEGAPPEAIAQYDQVVGFVQALGASQLSDLEQLKEADIRGFLAKEGAQLLGFMNQAGDMEVNPDLTEGLNAIKKLQARTVSIDGDTATVEVTEANGEKHEEQMKRVGDRWVPDDLADDWEGMIEEMRGGMGMLAFQGDEGAAMKEQVMGGIQMATMVVNAIAGAETTEELEEAFAPIVQGVMGAMGASQGAEAMNAGRNIYMSAMASSFDDGVGFGKPGAYATTTDYIKALFKDEPDLLEAVMPGAWSLVEGSTAEDAAGIPVLVSANLGSRIKSLDDANLQAAAAQALAEGPIIVILSSGATHQFQDPAKLAAIFGNIPDAAKSRKVLKP